MLQSAGASLGPTFATLYAQGDLERLEKVVVKSARAMMVASLPIVLILVVFGKSILSLYGPAYLSAYPALIVMVIGQFVNVGTGSIGPLLLMTGHEKYSLIGQVISVILYIVLLVVIIPPLGIMGAAIATTINLISWNVLLAWFAWRKLGIVSTALGRLTGQHPR
jgi:O-antigen/teichoic acid export membrane protein